MTALVTCREKIVMSKINQEAGLFSAATWPFVSFFALWCFPGSLRFTQLSWDLCCCATARRAETALLSLADIQEPVPAEGLPRANRAAQQTWSYLGCCKRGTRHFRQPQQTPSGFALERRGKGSNKQKHAQGKSSYFSSLMSDSFMSTNTLDVCVQASTVI